MCSYGYVNCCVDYACSSYDIVDIAFRFLVISLRHPLRYTWLGEVAFAHSFAQDVGTAVENGQNAAKVCLRPSSDVELFMCRAYAMQMSSNKELRSLTLGLAHEKFDV